MLDLNNRESKKVFKKAEELNQQIKSFNNMTLSELNDYYNKTEVLLDYIQNLKEYLQEQEQETGE